MVNRIRYTGILGYALVCEINLAFCIQGNVLKQCVSLDSVVDVRLGIFVQVDKLCVAAALEVEYAVVVLAVLVITDEETLRVGGKGGLTGTGQTKEDSGVLTVQVSVSGAVHGSDAL